MAKYYHSIDTCPILVFIQISQGKKGVDSLCFDGKPDESQSLAAWNQLYNEYIEEFGVSADYKHYTRQRIQLCSMLESYYVKGERWQKLLIEIKRSEIKKLEEQISMSENDFNKTLGQLSKRMGFGIDPMKTSIRLFYSYLKA